MNAVLSDIALWPADVVLVRDLGGVSRWIRAFETLRTGEAFVSHAALAVDQAMLIESRWRIRRCPSAAYDRAQVVVWRHRYLTAEQRWSIVGAAKALEGQHYGVLKLPLFAADAVCAGLASLLGCGWPDYFIRLFGITRFKVCSQFIAWCYERGLNGECLRPFGAPWRQITPDAIDDYCLAHAGDWEEVFSTLRLRGRLEAA